MSKTLRHHSRLLAFLFLTYGFLHLGVGGFIWLIVLALLGEGYLNLLREFKTLSLFGMTLAVVVMPLLTGYALLGFKPWARGLVCFTCRALLIVCVIVLHQLTWPMLSIARVVFGSLYGGVNLVLCLYSIWFVSVKSREAAVDTF